MTVRTAIITAPRPRPTLSQSLGSFRRAGFEGDVIVCADGEFDYDVATLPRVSVIRNEIHLGNKRNWTRALQLLTHGAKPGDWLMVCEDDIVWQVNAYADLAFDLKVMGMSNRLHMVGALSLFTCRRMSKAAENTRGSKLSPGWHWENMQFGRKTWGAQCLLFNTDMADWLLYNKDFKNYQADESMDKNIDLIVGECLNRSGRKIMYRVPCLVDHRLGYGNSSLGYKDDRPNLMTDYFKGPEA